MTEHGKGGASVSTFPFVIGDARLGRQQPDTCMDVYMHRIYMVSVVALHGELAGLMLRRMKDE